MFCLSSQDDYPNEPLFSERTYRYDRSLHKLRRTDMIGAFINSGGKFGGFGVSQQVTVEMGFRSPMKPVHSSRTE